MRQFSADNPIKKLSEQGPLPPGTTPELLARYFLDAMEGKVQWNMTPPMPLAFVVSETVRFNLVDETVQAIRDSFKVSDRLSKSKKEAKAREARVDNMREEAVDKFYEVMRLLGTPLNFVPSPS